MRGKEHILAIDAVNAGITPACAGKRRAVLGCNAVRWDHPRVCGEKMCCTAIALRSSGSPPRVRGKVGDWRC